MSAIFTEVTDNPLTTLLGVFLLVTLAFEIAMFIDLIRNESTPFNQKILWIIGMLLINPVVAVMYYFIARKVRPSR